MSHKTLTIGILAHADAGKTSLTECLLHTSGATKNRGSVDKGSAITDGLAMEKSRGISIKTSTVSFKWENTTINIVDTPGHIDFSAEVDRALSILDFVVLVVSSVEGVQAHTLNLWEALRERDLPVLIFINKIDRVGADPEMVFTNLEKDLNTNLFALNFPNIIPQQTPTLLNFNEFSINDGHTIINKSFENLAELDDDFMEAYLENTITDLDKVLVLAKKQLINNNLKAVVFGSAKLNLGINTILHNIANLFPPNIINSTDVVGKVFKVAYDAKLGRLAHFRLYSGQLQSKNSVWSQNLNKVFKINQLFKPDLNKLTQVKDLQAGEIGIMTTSDIVIAGDILGETKIQDNYNAINETVLSVQVKAINDVDYQKLGEALEILDIEDPTLNFKWFKDEKEFHIRILGAIQTEVLKDSLLNRFSIEAEFLTPKVIYKETPRKSAEGYVRYWMPKPCWAIMTFLIEPAPLNSGVEFINKVRTTDISLKYINEVKRAIPWSLSQGIKGWEVTDLKITLIEGSEHNVHSNPGDFLLATPMGILRGLENTETDLLEPMYKFQIKANQTYLGPVSSDLNQMGAIIDAPEFDNDFFTLSGRVPVAKAMNYGIKFSATTSGKGRLKFTLDGYEKTTLSDDKVRPYKGVSPLDESQWILHKRGAFKADEYKHW